MDSVTVHSAVQLVPQSRWRLLLLGYTVAAASVAIVLLMKENASAQRAVDAIPLLLAAVGIAAWFGGMGPGIGAVVMATLAFDYYFVPPIETWAQGNKDLRSVIVFGLAAMFVCWISAARRWAEEALRAARDEMETKVVERTLDLARTNDQLRAEIAERQRTASALEEVAGRLIGAQEDERSRIGRELHDHVSQRLGILAIKIDQLRMHPSSGAEFVRALDELREQTSEITDDIHSLSHRLHSSMLDHLGVVPAVQRLVKECSERYGIPIAFTHAPLPGPVASDVALCLFRIVEESLTNIARHSRAASATVDVASDRDGIRLTVADEGVGFDPGLIDTREGLGLVSMRERLRLVKGNIRIHSAPSRGTRIDAWVPSGHGVG